MAQEWQKTVAGYVNASDYVYASVVDTAYPVKDDFLTSRNRFLHNMRPGQKRPV